VPAGRDGQRQLPSEWLLISCPRLLVDQKKNCSLHFYLQGLYPKSICIYLTINFWKII
jgi:hypothetical protein